MIARKIRGVFAAIALASALPVWGAYVPAQPLGSAAAGISLDSSFQSDAWLVYTYDIDASGRVVNATIRYSNGVLEVEQAVLQQLAAMRYRPAQRNGSPVTASAGPVTYTWILDKPRELSPRFRDMYERAWAYYAEGDYDTASDIAVGLKSYSGRNALEEVKYRILAASLASRREDEALELRHLNRVVDFQDLALSNNFNNLYVPSEQYLKVLKRVMTLQLNNNMLADAGDTLDSMRSLGAGSAILGEAENRYRQAQQAFQSIEDLAIQGELVALYRGGAGSWKVGLSRERFSLGEVSGRVDSLFLVCAQAEQQLRHPTNTPWTIPSGWSRCLVDISGEAGTRLVLHQQGSGR